MKYLISSILLITSTIVFAQQSTFRAVISENGWDGKNIPKTQVCKRFGGKEATSPTINVDGIPEDANAILISFSDDSYRPMSNGGH